MRLYTHTHTHTGNQINEELIINNEKINNINVGADASVRPEHKGNTQKGITLLALIITIIVLLILSVVSVQLVTKSGIIERAKQGVIKHKLEEIHENVKLSYTSLKLGNKLSVITMSDEIKKLQENKYKKYIEKLNYTSTKVLYKMTDKLDGKEYMIDIKTGKIGIYEDKLQRVEADETLWDFVEHTKTIKGYFGTGELLKNVTVPNVIKKKDGREGKVADVHISKNINFEGTLTFASGLTIYYETITNCPKLESIIIGDDVKILSRQFRTPPFSNCSNIKNVTMGRNINMEAFGGKDDAPFYNSKVEKLTIESLSGVYNYAFANVGSALQGDIVINEGVTTIGDSAFKDCSNITSVNIPSTVTQIGASAFENCTNLKTAKLPEVIKKLGNNAFYNCINLSDEIEIKEGVTIESSAFSKTNIPKVTIGNNITLPLGSFNDCPKLESIIIGDNVKIQSRQFRTPPFSNCSNIKNVTMGRNINMEAFGGKDDAPFYNSKVEKLTIESLSGVYNYAFANVGSALQGDIVINEGVTTIGDSAFKDCSNITSVNIPSTVTQIGVSAFENCKALKTINVNMTENEWNSVTKGKGWNQNITANIVFK